jgi:hypothetical protein
LILISGNTKNNKEGHEFTEEVVTKKLRFHQLYYGALGLKDGYSC